MGTCFTSLYKFWWAVHNQGALKCIKVKGFLGNSDTEGQLTIKGYLKKCFPPKTFSWLNV